MPKKGYCLYDLDLIKSLCDGKRFSKDIAKIKENDFIRAYGDEICVNINKPIVCITMKEYQHNYQKIYREIKKSKSNVEENPPQELSA